MCTNNWTHASFDEPGFTCRAYGCGGKSELGSGDAGGTCALVLLVGALVAGLLGLGGYTGATAAYAAVTHSEVSR